MTRGAPRLLSIQSHVALGYVGNRAAVFPLQRLGYDVVAVNTVEFSNHTGYGRWSGPVLNPADVAAVIDGVDALGGLRGLTAMLSGYIGDPALGRVVLDTVRRVRAQSPDALYCCDPVMGDVGRGFFVRPELPAFFRDEALSVADILTPNLFELAFLADRATDTLDEVLAATAALRAKGPRTVLVTSVVRADAPADHIEMLADGPDGAWLVATPRLPLDPAPNGAGDAVAALFLAHFLATRDGARALERAAAAIYAVFEATAAAGTRELALVPAQNRMVDPLHHFRAVRVG